ncbi:MotA/TolQ/ExbB proton channel family protein [Roseiconus nitratireducens]|uniref:MotA/TolQ/ExbB proton channel family protein n=2 Tax=Roseiconus nitratireducens TaxID=2605748 RepID=A0A5M6DAV1_9BACT|nr:MotA/TolQ/ExbB proton channel family protein [Roseiconus nitratireducens]
MCLLATTMAGARVWGQDDELQGEPPATLQPADIQAMMDDNAAPAPPPAAEPSGIDMLSLIASGGRFMIPIGLMSVLVLTLAVERMLSLRREKILPADLVGELREIAEPIDAFDPTDAYEACLQNPSPTASVIGSMLMRTGQPLGEIERTANETIQREADRCAAPIRWLNLAAAATPLMGLLGTVWGMIVAFHESTSLSADRSRSEQLSEGIYTALVTTLAGLAVAIPAAIFAQYLENRVVKLFHRIQELAFELAPGLARFAGHRRMDSTGALLPIDGAHANLEPISPPPPPPGKSSSGYRQEPRTGESPAAAGRAAKAN